MHRHLTIPEGGHESGGRDSSDDHGKPTQAFTGWFPLLSLYLSVLILALTPPVAWGLAGKPLLAPAPLSLSPLTPHTFDRPVFLTGVPDDTGRLFVLEQEGRILVVTDGQVRETPALDIANRVRSGGEKGLLGLAFHPKFSSNRRLLLNYTRQADSATVIAEYRWPADRDTIDREERVILVIAQPYGNHNGGMLAFGPDQYLYIGMGDGGSGGDPENRAQDPQELLGKFLRIDVNRFPPYAIPPDNPFVQGPGKPEIFALGLRNPWRFSFDRQTGDLWAADVGQNKWEEVNIIQKGKNYGWRLLEGSHCYNPPTNCETVPNLVHPVTEYGHEQGRCSITGGYVYRGKQLPELAGTYVFGDFCTGEIWGYRNGLTTLLLKTDLQISSFGEDQEGELYVVGYQGKIFRIVPMPSATLP